MSYAFRYGVSCALEPQPERQPVVIRGDIEAVAAGAAKAGYDAIELFIREPRQYDPKRLRTAAADQGLAFCAISTGMEYNLNHLCLIDEDAAVRIAAVDRLKAHLDLGAAIGCPVVVGIMRGNIPDFSRYQEYEDRFAAALTELSGYAVSAGAEIVVESITRYINNYLNSAPETADFLRRLALPKVGLHIDTHSMAVEDQDLAQSVRETADLIRYVHFSDSNRRYPGAGNIDFKSVLAALMDVGYQGYISVESPPWPTQALCARRGLDYIRHLLALLEIERASDEDGSC